MTAKAGDQRFARVVLIGMVVERRPDAPESRVERRRQAHLKDVLFGVGELERGCELRQRRDVAVGPVEQAVASLDLGIDGAQRIVAINEAPFGFD